MKSQSVYNFNWNVQSKNPQMGSEYKKWLRNWIWFDAKFIFAINFWTFWWQSQRFYRFQFVEISFFLCRCSNCKLVFRSFLSNENDRMKQNSFEFKSVRCCGDVWHITCMQANHISFIHFLLPSFIHSQVVACAEFYEAHIILRLRQWCWR